MKILIAEDSDSKFQEIEAELNHFADRGVRLLRAASLVEARRALEHEQYSLLILDQYLPMRKGDDPLPDGGARLLADIATFESVKRPLQIFGLTAYDEVHAPGFTFSEQAWYCCRFDVSSAWRTRLSSKVQYLLDLEAENDGGLKNYSTDVAIVAALHDPELRQVYALPCEWRSKKIVGDSAEYLTGNVVDKHGQPISLVSMAVGEMGMASSSAACMKLISQYRPRLIIMAGITGGVAGEVKLGDVIVSERCWNCESGKLKDSSSGEPEFLPEPRQIAIDQSLANIINRMAAEDNEPVTKIDHSGTSRVRIGPTASNSAVVQSSSRIKELIYQNRKLLGIEMETFGVYQACISASLPKPYYFSAKAVSDFADLKKNDRHRYIAASASAAFILEFIVNEFAAWKKQMCL